MKHSHQTMTWHVGKTIACLAAAGAGFAAIIPAMGMEQWSVPLGGNAYLTFSAAGSPDRVESSGIRQWQNEKSVFSI